MNQFRPRLSEEEYKMIIDFRANTDTKTNQYDQVTMSAFDNNGHVMDIDAYCDHYNLPRQNIRSYKLVTHTGTPFYNIAFHEVKNEFEFLTGEFLESIVKKNLGQSEFTGNIPKENRSGCVTRAIYTDVHVGMHPDKQGISLYGGKWDKEEQVKRVELMALDIIVSAQNNDSSKVIIDELGDFVDGWDGMTVRRGHTLPQNLTNEEAFDQAVRLKVMLCDKLVIQNIFSEIIFNNICNDNHAGSFGYVVNSAVKSILELKYKHVKVNNHRKFINHYTVGNHTFIISHGKDKEDSKFGFKPQLDAAGEKKITNYITTNGLTGLIEFSKGDSHQCMYDYATSDLFVYLNHAAFSPPSQWVQTNYQKGRSGYSIQTFWENIEEIPITHPRFF